MNSVEDGRLSFDALALFAIFLAVDRALLVSMVESCTGAPFFAIGLSLFTKLGACALDGRLNDSCAPRRHSGASRRETEP
jgi:hypothetical protein